jgi:LysR family pca operon transcriptional activator
MKFFLQFAEQSKAALRHGLRSGGFDLVVGRLGKPDTMIGSSFQPLFSEEVVAVAHPDSPATGVKDVAELEECRVLYPP